MLGYHSMWIFVFQKKKKTAPKWLINEMVYCWDCHITIYIYRQVLSYSKQPQTQKGVINTYQRILEYPMPAHVSWPLDREYILYDMIIYVPCMYIYPNL